MRRFHPRLIASALLAAALLASGDIHSHGENPGTKVTPLMRQPLSDHQGKDGVMVTVEYAPGHIEAAHRHPGHVFVYVLEGTVEMQLASGELQAFGPGDTFYENPMDTHLVGRNVSKTQPAKLLVFFVAEQGRPLVLPLQPR